MWPCSQRFDQAALNYLIAKLELVETRILSYNGKQIIWLIHGVWQIDDKIIDNDVIKFLRSYKALQWSSMAEKSFPSNVWWLT